MSKYIVCDQEVRNFLIRVAVNNKYPMFGEPEGLRKSIDTYPNLVICDDGDLCGAADEERLSTLKEYEKISFEEFYKIITNHKPVIKIDKYVVKFTPNGIEVGCTAVSKKQIKEIYERVFEIE